MYTTIRTCVAVLSLAVSTAAVAQITHSDDQLNSLEANGAVETSLRASDALSNFGPHYMNDLVAAHPAVPGAVDWTWSFHNTNGNELPIVINKGDDVRFIKLGDVPGLQHGNTYTVQVKPIMATGEVVPFGDPESIAIVAQAPQEEDLSVEFRNEELGAPTDLQISPKIVTGDRAQVTVGDWVTSQRPTKVGVRDNKGNALLKTQAMLAAGDQLELDLRNLENGLYTLIAISGDARREVTFKVNRERGFESANDLRVNPKVVTDERNVTATLGEWINDAEKSMIGIMDNEGNAIVKRTEALKAGDEIVFDVADLGVGIYTIRVSNNRETRTVSFKVDRSAERGFESANDLRVSPKVVSSERNVTVTLGEWIDDAEKTMIGIMDSEGNAVVKRTEALKAGDDVVFDVSELSVGIYTIRANNSRETRTVKFKVDRSENRDFEMPNTLTTEPRIVDGEGMKVIVGDWINDNRLTTFRVLDSDGKEVMRSESMAEPGQPVNLNVAELRNGRYTIQAINLNGREEAKFQVNRDRGFEAVTDDLQVFPNPVRERDMRVKVGTWIDRETFTGMRIYDDNGNVKTSQSTRVEPGETVRMDVSMLDNGEYNLVVVNGRERRTLRISVRR